MNSIYATHIGEKGFTFVELLLSVAMIAIVILGIMGANAIIAQNSETVYERSIAVQDAYRVLEQIRDSAASGTFPADLITSFPDAETVQGFDNLTDEEVTVTYEDVTADPLDVTVAVTWLGNGRQGFATALRTLVTQRA